MFRPMICAPMPSPKRLAKSLSGPVVPPVFPFISRNARVPMYQPCSSSPPTPSGSFSPWRGPAPYPSSEIAKLWTRSLDMESFSGFHMRRMGRPEIDRRRMSRSEEHTSELQSRSDLVCRLLLEKKKQTMNQQYREEH